MSVRSSDFYGDADGHHWHVWHNSMRSRPGVFVEVNREKGEPDEWGYYDIDVEEWTPAPVAFTGAEVSLFIPRAVCEAIAEWVATEKRNRR